MWIPLLPIVSWCEHSSLGTTAVDACNHAALQSAPKMSSLSSPLRFALKKEHTKEAYSRLSENFWTKILSRWKTEKLRKDSLTRFNDVFKRLVVLTGTTRVFVHRCEQILCLDLGLLAGDVAECLPAKKHRHRHRETHSTIDVFS